MTRALIALATLVLSQQVNAQAPPSAKPVVVVDAAKDAANAEAALKSIIEVYRSDKGLRVESKASTSAVKGEAVGKGTEVDATFVFTSQRRAVMNFRKFELHIGGGKIVATHDSNALAYLEVNDNGSPYYQLFNAFQALPFPELALALGEDDPTEVCMQLMPQIPNVVPTRVEQVETEGQVYDMLVLLSDDGSEELRLSFDPDTKFVEIAEGVLRGGPNAEAGSELRFSVTSKVSRPKEAPTDAMFVVDVSSKQKVDGLSALIDKREEAAEDKTVAGLKAGEPAPELVLPRVGEAGEWSLAAARGKPVLVDFWATWCGPCVGAIPELDKLATEFAGRVEVVMVNTGETGSREEREARIADVMKKRNVGVDSALKGVLDLDAAASRRWLVRAFPTTFLIAPDGTIAGVWVGSSPTSQKELHAKLTELTAVKTPATSVSPAIPAAK